MPTTRIMITKEGKIIVEGIGYIGDECINDLQRIQQVLSSLGVQVNVEIQQKKPEAYISSSREVAEHGG